MIFFSLKWDCYQGYLVTIIDLLISYDLICYISQDLIRIKNYDLSQSPTYRSIWRCLGGVLSWLAQLKFVNE